MADRQKNIQIQKIHIMHAMFWTKMYTKKKTIVSVVSHICIKFELNERIMVLRKWMVWEFCGCSPNILCFDYDDDDDDVDIVDHHDDISIMTPAIWVVLKSLKMLPVIHFCFHLMTLKSIWLWIEIVN